jgi:GMP reductase
MDNLATFSMADALSGYKILTCLIKHYPLQDLISYFTSLSEDKLDYVSYSMGISDRDLIKFNEFKLKAPINIVTIDAANGYMEKFVNFCKKFREENPSVTIIAGNVCTGEMVEELALNGVDIIKAGIGGGAQCTTRMKTAIGRPMVSTILECADKAHHHEVLLMADGGITCPGDACIAFGSGSDFVMVGSQWAATQETGAELIEENGKKFMLFYGMSSSEAQKNHDAGGLKDYRASEGRVSRLPYRGSIHPIIQDYLGGLRSTMAYVGSRSLKSFPRKTTLIKVNNRLNTSLAIHTTNLM